MTDLETQESQDMASAVVLVDRDFFVCHADPNLSQLLGRCDSVLGRSIVSVLPSPCLADALDSVLAGEPRRVLTVIAEHPVRHLLVAVTRVQALCPEGPVLSLLVTSAHEHRESAEARSASQLRATIESVIAGFAHEVRNPIAAMLSITEAALTELDESSRAAALLSRIPPLVNRVDKLIKQSLHYSRPRSPQRAPRSLRQLVSWSLEMAQMQRGEVELEVALEDDISDVLVDAEQIEQVLVNLLRNAREAARSKVRVMGTRGHGRKGTIVLEVSDDGPGVPPEHHHRIFEPFFTTKANGTGLGLAIARDLARINGGELELHATSSEGTTFSLQLEEARRSRRGRGAHVERV